MIIRARGHLHWHCGNLYQRQLYPRLGAGCTELRPHEGFGDDKEVLLQDTRGVSPKARVMWYHLTWLNCLEKVENQSHSGVQHLDSTILSTQLFRHYNGTTEASSSSPLYIQWETQEIGLTSLRYSYTSRGLRLLEITSIPAEVWEVPVTEDLAMWSTPILSASSVARE